MSGSVLNLDELFGQSNPVEVIHNQRRYEFIRPEGLSPEQYTEWIDLQKKIEVLQQTAGQLSTEQSKEWDMLVTRVIELLCPAFAALNLPFSYRTKVLEFYFQTVFPELAEKAKTSKNPTGAERSLD